MNLSIYVDKKMDYLAKAEGSLIHYNNGERDITLPYGLYLQNKSNLYHYIVELGESEGITTPTSSWSKDDISIVNELVEKSAYGVRQLAKEFYMEFMRKAHLDLYPDACKDVIYSLYINSPKYSTMAVQRSIRNMVKSKRLDLNLHETSIEDGGWGTKTRKSLELIMKQNKEFSWYFEEAIINNMEDIYEEIADTDSEKKNLKGWKNRVRYFQSRA